MSYPKMAAIILVIIAIIGSVTLSFLANRMRYVDVVDVTKRETIVIKKRPELKYVNTIKLTLNGQVDGKAEITVSYPDKSTPRTEKISGNINYRMFTHMDWYADEAVIEYVPTSVTKGKLRIWYEFY